MTHNAELDALIARIESGEVLTREFDFWVWWWCKAVHGGHEPDQDYVRVNLQKDDAPHYGSSFDAIMSLARNEIDSCIILTSALNTQLSIGSSRREVFNPEPILRAMLIKALEMRRT